MKVHIRFDESNAKHTKFTLFLNGGNCGQLTARTDEAANLHQIIFNGHRKGIDEVKSKGKFYVPWECK